MENALYTALTRQSGLLREMDQVANNIANMSTTGFRREGLIFSEFVQGTGPGEPSLSMAAARVRDTDLLQGALRQTASPFDMAIEGPGFFLIETPAGERLTRAGNFSPSAAGELVTPDGHRLLAEGSAPVFVPPDASVIALGADGTLSADGAPIARIGLWEPVDPIDLGRQDGVLFAAASGIAQVEEGRILQGFLEGSNVNPIAEVARMIEVQRSYEMAQSFLDTEDERIRNVLRTIPGQQ
ncbi:flagellar hook-basal body complex protein [Palleronia sp. KMU-117]|uniref:flagellar hook-basal body complex protein n=1 Tax=Palleronia sp. KMU-117 TaxID=3434108 RepID=UPI003D73E030